MVKLWRSSSSNRGSSSVSTLGSGDGIAGVECPWGGMGDFDFDFLDDDD